MSVVWPLLVFAGVVGWGSAGCRAAHRFAGIDLDTLADRLGLGLAVEATLVGFAIVVGVPHVAGGLVVLGAVIGLADLVQRLRAGTVRLTEPVVRTVAIGAAILVPVGLYAASLAMNFAWNSCDDNNYLLLAQRIVQHGDLADPSNVRRIQNFGAMSGIQAMYLDQLGDRVLPFADLFLGAALIMSALWRTRDGRWSPWGIGAGAAVLVAYPTLTGIDYNTSPVLLPVGLFLLTGRLLIELRSEDRTTRALVGRGVVIGLLVALAFAMRQNVGQPLAVLAFVAAVWPPVGRVVLQRLGAIAAGGALGLLGWSIASWRDVATPLYPLLSGNADPDFPALGVQLVERTAGELVGRVGERLVSPLWIVLLGVAVAAVVLVRRARPRDRSYFDAALVVQVAAAVISVLWLVVMTVLMWNLAREAHNLLPRYYAWMFLGVGLLPIVVVNGAPGRADRTGTRSSAVVGVAAALVLLVASVGVVDDVGRAARDIASGNLLSELATSGFASLAPDYDAVQDLIPPGSKVFTAVDVPDQLLDGDFTVHSIDLTGFASPPPRLPYFEGDQAKTDWLRANGYDYLVAMVRDTSTCFYRAELWQRALDLPESRAFALAWQPYIQDWSDYVDHLQAQEGSETVGRLVVVPLDP